MRSTSRGILAGAALAGAALVALVAAAWAPERAPESLAARWAPPPSAFLDVGGLRVHVRDEGPRDDPEPVVLLHGTSASLHTWEGWAQALSERRRVVRFDLPGFGLTGPNPAGDYRDVAYVDFVGRVLDALGLERVVLGGNSLGGGIAWEFAARAPARVAALVLVDAAGYAFDAESTPLGFRIARHPAVAPLVSRVLPRFVVERSVRDVYGDPSRVTPELVDRYYELALREGNREALARRFAQSRRGEHAAAIASLRAPTLILWGGRDRLIPPANSERFARDIAGSRRVVFDALGHVPHEEDPRATVRALQDFLDTIPRRDPR